MSENVNNKKQKLNTDEQITLLKNQIKKIKAKEKEQARKINIKKINELLKILNKNNDFKNDFNTLLQKYNLEKLYF